MNNCYSVLYFCCQFYHGNKLSVNCGFEVWSSCSEHFSCFFVVRPIQDSYQILQNCWKVESPFRPLFTSANSPFFFNIAAATALFSFFSPTFIITFKNFHASTQKVRCFSSTSNITTVFIIFFNHITIIIFVIVAVDVATRLLFLFILQVFFALYYKYEKTIILSVLYLSFLDDFTNLNIMIISSGVGTTISQTLSPVSELCFSFIFMFLG